ncbi:MAG: serine hydrolase domain-containing protein [Myxococcota bacterium]|nr:serine hydrolase domain-containing protein [Myxococcota bacterium]
MKLSQVRRKLGRVDRAIEKAIARSEIPGAVVRARQGPESEGLSYEGVFGLSSVSPERCVTRPDTLYDLASLTKVVATTPAILLLVAQGRLELDRPVADVLPAFGERGKEKITVRHLLTHSSGLRPWRAYFDDLRERERRRGERLLATEAGREAIVSRILRSSPVHEAGAASAYGDLGFIVLGELVAEVSGQRLDEFCQKQIYAPLGLVHTHFNPVPFGGDPSRYAGSEQCEWREKILCGEVHDPNAWAMGGVAGHAGLFSTAGDLMRFADEMLAADRGQSELFPAVIAHEFFRRQGPESGAAPNSDWALGWDTPSDGRSTSGRYFSPRSIGHVGFTGTSLWIDLEQQVSIVLLTSRQHLVAKRSQFSLRPLTHDLIREAFLAA